MVAPNAQKLVYLMGQSLGLCSVIDTKKRKETWDKYMEEWFKTLES